MNIRIVKNKYLNAVFVLMLFSAIVHMVILFFLSFKTKDIYVLNYFNILDIDLFIPNILNNNLGNFISFVFMIFIYIAILKINKTENA